MTATETLLHDGDPQTAGAAADKTTLAKPTTAVELLQHLVSLRDGGEVRPQQETMVEAVAKAMTTRRHLTVQAGTGTGKSLGYLIPAVFSGKRVVVSTATKQLGEQLVNEDLPTLARHVPQATGRSFSFALSKGRQNFACLAAIDELVALDKQAPDEHITEALFDVEVPEARSPKAPTSADLEALNSLLKWAETTETGDRSDAPAVPDKVWDQVSTDAAGCPGAKACPFSSNCFSEANRAQAGEADIVVTNHAQVAQDLRNGNALFGDYDVLITDEMHELVSYLSSAWGSELVPSKAKQTLALAARKVPRSDEKTAEVVKSAMHDLDALADLLGQEEGGLKPELPEHIQSLILTTAQKILSVAQTLKRAADREGKEQTAAEMTGAAGKAAEVCETMVSIATVGDDAVRWLEAARGNRQAVLKTAPLWVGPKLQGYLDDKTLIATSATITVADSFDSAVRELALGTSPGVDSDTGQPIPPRGFDTLDVGTPFNYPAQGMLYVPGPGFPDPVGADRFEHTKAVQEELTTLITASGGRALALFTTTKAAKDAAEHLRKTISTPVLCQGDAPPSQLLEEFADVEESTLCATMGFWHGVNVPGPGLSLVVMDKIPFAPMNDPLMAARREDADKNRRNGFTEVFVASAAVMLAQGAGRLIRTATDRGVVAVLDRRILTKGYSRAMISAIPNFGLYQDRDMVTGALTRLTGGAPAAKPTNAAARRASTTRDDTASSAAPKVRRAAPSRASTRRMASRTKGATKNG